MKNLGLYILGIFALFLSACSTQQEFTSLKEYDDVYYQGSAKVTSSPTAVQVSEDRMEGASDAERSYYQNQPFSEKVEKEKSYDAESDYYDEDYANRIQNFHRHNDGGYIYSQPYSTSPRMSMSFGYGMSPYYGSSFSWGMRYGTGFYDPFYSPWYRPYSPYYSLYYGYSPFYDPFYYDPFYSYRFGYPYGRYYGYYPYSYYPYSYYPYYYYPSYGGDYFGKSSNITSVPRDNVNTVRPSRGGVITEGNNNSGRQEISRSPGATNRATESTTRDQVQRGTADQSDLRRTDVRSREENQRERVQTPSDRTQLNRTDYTRPGTTRSDYTRREQATPQERRVPATRESNIIDRQSQPSRITAPAQRSRTERINQQYDNQRQQNQRQGIFSSPTRQSPSSPTYQNQRRSYDSAPSSSPNRGTYSSPSRNSGGTIGGGTNRSSSPASTPSRGSRR